MAGGNIYVGGGYSKKGDQLNYSVVASATKPTTPTENTIWVNTDVKIPIHAFAEENPFLEPKATNLMDGAEITKGYILEAGGTGSQDGTKKEYYTKNYIPVEYGKTYTYNYTLSVSKSMWLAIAEYVDGKDFSKRVVVVNNITGTTQTGVYTPSSSDVNSVRISWRSFEGSATCTVEFIGDVLIIPEDTPNGAVWFKTQETSQAPINIIKENELYIYPSDCYQYINNELVQLEAKTYQYRGWQGWVRYLYNKGNTYESVTGGWTTGKKGWDSEAVSGLAPTLTFEDEYLSIYHKATNYGGGYARLTNMINLTNYSTLVLEGSFIANRTTNRLFIWTAMGTYLPSSAAAYVNLSTLMDINKIELDISSLSGEHYIGFGMYSVSGTYADIQISRMYLR